MTGYLDKAAILEAVSNQKCREGATWEMFQKRIERGEFDARCPPCSGPVWDNLNNALADKDAEIAHLKEEIEKRNVIIQNHCVKIAKLKKAYDEGYREYEKVAHENIELRKEKYETWSKVMQQDQELKDLGKALQEAKLDMAKEISAIIEGEWMCSLPEVLYIIDCVSKGNHDPFNGSKKEPSKEEIEREIRKQVTEAVNSIPGAVLAGEIKIEHVPAKDPELVICGEHKTCSNFECIHKTPHQFSRDLGCDNDNCGSGCIPYKKEEPTVPQECKYAEQEKKHVQCNKEGDCEHQFFFEHQDEAYCALGEPDQINIQQAHTAQIEACQDRLDALEKGDRIDTLEKQVAHLNEVLSVVGGFGSDRLYEIEVSLKRIDQAKTDMTHLRDRIFECEQHQGRDRANFIAEIRDLIKSIGDLNIRLDKVEVAIQKIQEK